AEGEGGLFAQVRLDDADAVDPRAVGAVQVAEAVAVRLAGELRVEAGDGGVGEDEVVPFLRADGDPLRRGGDGLSGGRAQQRAADPKAHGRLAGADDLGQGGQGRGILVPPGGNGWISPRPPSPAAPRTEGSAPPSPSSCSRPPPQPARPPPPSPPAPAPSPPRSRTDPPAASPARARSPPRTAAPPPSPPPPAAPRWRPSPAG